MSARIATVRPLCPVNYGLMDIFYIMKLVMKILPPPAPPWRGERRRRRSSSSSRRKRRSRRSRRS